MAYSDSVFNDTRRDNGIQWDCIQRRVTQTLTERDCLLNIKLTCDLLLIVISGDSGYFEYRVLVATYRGRGS